MNSEGYRRGLLKRAVSPVIQSLRTLGLKTKMAYVTFLYYNRESKDFELVDFVDKNPLFQMHKDQDFGEGRFCYAYRAIRERKYQVCPDVQSKECRWDDTIKAVAKTKRIRSVISMPVVALERANSEPRENVFGVVNACFSHTLNTGTVSEERLVALCGLVAEGVSKLVENEALHEEQTEWQAQCYEIKMVKELQAQATPTAPLDAAGFDVFGMSRAAGAVSGDIFDYFDAGDGLIVVNVADAEGKGLRAAYLGIVYSALFRSVFHDPILQYGGDLNQYVRELVKRFYFGVSSMGLVDWFVGLLSRDGTLTYVKGGTISVTLYRQGAERAKFDRIVESQTLQLGIVQDVPELVLETIKLQPEDLVVIVTDGVVAEPGRNAGFDIDHIENVIKRYYGMSAKDIVDMLFASLDKVLGEMPPKEDAHELDDQTALVIRRK